jgi:3-deoxy-D-manno-octulosonic-acid transferase
MFILYDLIFFLFAVCYLPVFLFKKKIHAGISRRMGIFPRVPVLAARAVWIHAVSVGEAISVKHLIEDLRCDLPDKKFVISTVTPTGNKIARGIAAEGDLVTYLPFDLSFIVKKVIDRVNPVLFVIAETEIWPNLIRYLAQKNIPIIVVNARISDNSFKGYRWIKFWLKPILNKINTFCVQTKQDAERLIGLGVQNDKIKITGNMKFDIEIRDYTELKKDYTNYRTKFGLGIKDRLLIAASTHPGEEEMVLAVYKELLKDFPDLKLLIAPRHPERAPEIDKVITKHSFTSLRISLLGSKHRPGPQETQGLQKPVVFVLDTIGQLMYFYAISDIVFVGGSLVKKGGHNILEPASLGKPIIFGQHMFNFRDIAKLFILSGAAVMVKDTGELKSRIKYLLDGDSKISELGHSAKEILRKNQGATKRNKETIITLLKERRN